ncbi:MAG: sulfotransferase, partial [Phycisphaeraceae bacterium]|nr:sulfotransferase [Phycisphaeraceae bacterium]
NLHPNVFVTHESDMVWLLYQLSRGERPRAHPWDGPAGLNATMRDCRDLLDALPPSWDVAEQFERLQLHLMKTRRGFDRDLHWLGDKKSVQQADPQLQPFVDAHFPGARFIHMTRHPRAVVASMVKAGRQWQVPVPYWREGAEHILERWIEHERWALAVDGPVLRLRFEDLCADPAGAMRRAFQFLDVDNTTALEREAAAMTKPDPDRKHADFALPPSADAEKLMQRYDYRIDA